MINKSKTNQYLKYSGLAFQMFVLLLIAVYAGQWLDNKFDFQRPYLTALLLIFALLSYFIKLYYDLIKK